MKAGDLASWVDRYVEAWKTNDPQDIERLFTQDARYYTAPHRKPWSGRVAIVKGWLDRKDDQGTWRFRYEILAVTEGLGFVRGWTTYVGNEAKEYSNLWVVRLDANGRCSEFTEWWMEQS